MRPMVTPSPPVAGVGPWGLVTRSDTIPVHCFLPASSCGHFCFCCRRGGFLEVLLSPRSLPHTRGYPRPHPPLTTPVTAHSPLLSPCSWSQIPPRLQHGPAHALSCPCSRQCPASATPLPLFPSHPLVQPSVPNGLLHGDLTGVPNSSRRGLGCSGVSLGATLTLPWQSR